MTETAKERQKLLDEAVKEMEAIKQRTSTKFPIYAEDVLEAEFLMFFGFEGYWALHTEKNREDGIDLTEMLRLVYAARKIGASELYRNAQASFIGGVAAQSGKRATIVFNKATEQIRKDMRVEV